MTLAPTRRVRSSASHAAPAAPRTGRLASRCRVTAHQLATAYTVMVVVLLSCANLPGLIGWRPVVVLSGSMHPALRAGDVVLLAPGGPDHPAGVGEIVAVGAPEKPGGSYLHRVRLRTGPHTLVTRGDANSQDDFPDVEDGQVVGRVRVAIPLVGIAYLRLRQGNPWPLIASAVPCLYVLARRRPARAARTVPPRKG